MPPNPDLTTGRGWPEPPAALQLLGLCPLLAISTSVVQGLALGIATTSVLALASLLVSASRNLLRREARLIAMLVIVATLVSALDLALQAWFYALHLALGLFVPLIASNCIILSRLDTFSARNPPLAALRDAVSSGLGFTVLFVALGVTRELLGRGSLLADADLLLGDWAQALTLRVSDGGLQLLILPPGAFIALALLLAGTRAVASVRARRTRSVEASAA